MSWVIWRLVQLYPVALEREFVVPERYKLAEIAEVCNRAFTPVDECDDPGAFEPVILAMLHDTIADGNHCIALFFTEGQLLWCPGIPVPPVRLTGGSVGDEGGARRGALAPHWCR